MKHGPAESTPRFDGACVLRVLNGQSEGLRLEWTPSPGEPLVIGRDPSRCGLVLADEHVSARHAMLEVDDDGRVIATDLGSTNGTRVATSGRLRPLSNRPLALQRVERLVVGDPDTPVVIHWFESAALERANDEARVVASTHIGRIEDLEGRLSGDPSVLRAIYGAIKRLARDLDLAAVVENGVETLFEMVPAATHVSLMLESEHQTRRDHDEARFVTVVCVRRDGRPQTPRPLSRWLRAEILEQRTGLLASDEANDFDSSASLRQQSISAMIAAPLWVGDRIIGIVQIDHRAGDSPTDEVARFTDRDLDLVMVLASQLALAVEHARVHQRLLASEQKLRRENSFLKTRESTPMVGHSPAMREVQDLIERVKDTNIAVCIMGETGTGKELVARQIHDRSRRADKLFVAQNCAALPEDLLESELFGHTRGAFTGADSDKKGLFEIADGGTIFLDEIGETTPAMQAKLLRVLQEGEIRPVGAVRTRHIDVRVISATNRNLEEEVQDGRFREDLFYRLAVFPLRLPPLRDRGSDISLLAEHFMRIYATELARPPLTFSASALDMLRSYKWPGNIRELQNEIQRLLICASGEFVMPEDISGRIRTVGKLLGAAGDDDDASLKERMANVERHILIEALRAHDNNKTHTAAALGITREGLHKKLTRLGIQA